MLSLVEVDLPEVVKIIFACIYTLYGQIYYMTKRFFLLFYSNHEDLNLAGKTILITGAANGIGKTLVEEILCFTPKRRPKKMILLDREDIDCLDMMVEDGTKTEIEKVKIDLTNRSEVDKFLPKNKNVDILVLNAGITNAKRFSNQSDVEYSKLMELNLQDGC